MGSCCISDGFDGAELALRWDPAHAGAPPTYGVSGSRLSITDAPFAPTPSMPSQSWIYDPDVDLGNQMAWTVPIGTGDFALTYDMDWSSTQAELTLAGVGLTNSRDQLEVYSGFRDGWSIMFGAPFARVRRSGTDATWTGAAAGSGSGTFRMVRAGGTVTISYGSAVVLTAASAADIAHIVVFAVAHRNPAPFPLGSFSVGRVQLCGARTTCPAGSCCSDADCPAGVCEAGSCRPGLGCAGGAREGFVNEAAWPDVAACGAAVTYGPAVAGAAAICAAGWHMCTTGEVSSLAGAEPVFPTGGFAWVGYRDTSTALYSDHLDLTCGGLRWVANLRGMGGCAASGVYPQGYRLGLSPATWGRSHSTTVGCVAHTDHFCGYPGGSSPAGAGHTLCCR